jgi:serine/threonine protein kinase
MDSNGKCLIVDFGLAKRIRRHFSGKGNRKMEEEDYEEDEEEEEEEEEEGCCERHSSSVGMQIFSSPEQTSSSNYDYRTDIYSLGMFIALLFCSSKTSHEESEILLNLRNKKLSDFDIDDRLKVLLGNSLSEQKLRPTLKDIKNCVKRLLREEMHGGEEEDGMEAEDVTAQLR